jgi:hypothetical protein
MTQTPPSLDDPTPDPQQSKEAEELSRRERAKLEKDNRDLNLKNLMLRAGLDPDEKMGKLFNGYDGEMSADAIKAAAVDAGIIQDPDAPPESPEPEAMTPEERQSTQERQTTATGVRPDGGVVGSDMDPRVRAVQVGEELMAQGASQEGAMAAAFDEIASAAFNDHDERAIWKAGKEDPRRPPSDW